MSRAKTGRKPYRQHPYRQVPYLVNSVPGPLHHTPLAFAHRGADPERENTMAAFQRAVDLGFRYLEIDVRTSADGELVIFHDETLDRTTDGTGRVSEHSWAQLSRLRVGGQPLVRFEDALRAFPDAHFNVDLKDAAAVDHFAEIVERLGAHDRVLAASFNDARRHRLRRLVSRHVATSGGWVSIGLMVLLGPFGGLGRLSQRLARIDCVQVPIRQSRIPVVRPKFVERCHAAGLQVHVWVVDDPQEMHRLLDLGVDGIMTDDAEALAAVMRERSVWPQTV
ncbi:glycerophosphodiester phosphodiesterase [Nesterenkonia alkaliphila]|uniref:Glycerophosphodiester phosphodiesterase n=1 Tax=Nesterenkonia alkaliphila TaxID=1463631 RepID=A0A7K1UMP6_9MICC|nr:glycerophosphodiester phosphodiesterase [Nesterenkonia alkaliphila]MVT27743.1 glycerophosphodiester phosphodiesterase [Nesterenkonia alkaliphila]GFZ87444.1 glycerophosphoryl diester phosphodiesterase [Nesterenkonia alkaliphila]